MAKWVKRLLSLAALGGVVAGLVYYLKKSSSDEDHEFAEDFEDEDFDLDSDLKPVSDREYVPLTPKSEEKASEDPKEKTEASAEETSEDTKKDTDTDN